jgi:hypothetical protein
MCGTLSAAEAPTAEEPSDEAPMAAEPDAGSQSEEQDEGTQTEQPEPAEERPSPDHRALPPTQDDEDLELYDLDVDPDELFYPLPPTYVTFSERLSFGVSAAVISPLDKEATLIERGQHYALHGTIHLTPYQALDLAGGYYETTLRIPFTDPIQSVTAQATYQIGGELPYGIGRWYVTPGVGYFLLDEELVGEDDDIVYQMGIGAEFWSLESRLRTRIEGGYLRLDKLEDEFLTGRLTLLVKF